MSANSGLALALSECKGARIERGLRPRFLATDAEGLEAALDTDGESRDSAQVCELTGLVPDDSYPAGIRFIVRRERPHPGAQLSLFDTIEGMRHQVMATETPPGDPTNGSIQYLQARHRGHARVEDRIRAGTKTPAPAGSRPGSSRSTKPGSSSPLPASTYSPGPNSSCSTGNWPPPNPKLRYRLLHVAARITRTARQTRLRIAGTWPWATDLAAAFTRLAVLPVAMAIAAAWRDYVRVCPTV